MGQIFVAFSECFNFIRMIAKEDSIDIESCADSIHTRIETLIPIGIYSHRITA